MERPAALEGNFAAQRRDENNHWPGRWLGQLEDVRRVVEEYHIDEVVISSTALSANQLFEVVRNLTTSSVEIRLSPNLHDILTTGLAVQEINGLPLVSVSKVRITGLNAILKTTFDLLVSALVLLIFSPLLLLCAALIRLDSPGSPLHRRQVVGQGGRVFYAFKLRTMRTDGEKILAARPELLEELQRTGKLKNDPRVTRLGHFLRKTSLDELPQLINVLRGQMSLVGPRMITYQEMIKFGRWQSNLMTVKPGLTGLWQVSGRSNLTYEDRVRLDMNYIRNYSLWVDIRILFLTIPAVLRSRGAY
jgi:exopolysaccharide biosynthesis polyprenyl glycosylphosphotransferase